LWGISSSNTFFWDFIIKHGKKHVTLYLWKLGKNMWSHSIQKRLRNPTIKQSGNQPGDTPQQGKILMGDVRH
jgi:hypothetical protein